MAVVDDSTMLQNSPSLAVLVPQAAAAFHPRDLAVLAVKPGDVVKVSGEYGSIGLPVKADESLVEGTVYVQANLSGSRALGASLIVQVDALRGDGS